MFKSKHRVRSVGGFFGVASIACSAIFATPLVAQDKVTKLDIASVFGTSNYLGQKAEKIAEDIKVISGGTLDMRVHNPGDLVPALEVFNSVSSGAVPVGFDWLGYWGGTIPVTGLFGGLPFGPNAEVFNSWVFDGGGVEILQRAYDPYGVHVVPCMISPPETGGWYSKEITGPEDFDGLTIRIAGYGAKVLSKLGASTQLIPGGEIYLALERGRIQAAEFATPMIDIAMGFDEVVDHYHFPGWHQRSNWDSLIFNQEVWDELSSTHQLQVELACRANIQRALSDHMPLQAAAMDTFKGKGVQFHRFSDETMEALSNAWDEVRTEEFAKDELLQEAYDSLMKHAAMFAEWDKLQDLSFAPE